MKKLTAEQMIAAKDARIRELEAALERISAWIPEESCEMFGCRGSECSGHEARRVLTGAEIPTNKVEK